MKISRSNFAAISVTMIAILILFQFSNLSAIYASQAMKNANALQDVSITVNKTVQASNLLSTSSYTTALVGSKSNQETIIAEEWCVYTKQPYYRFPSLDAFYGNISKNCKLLIVNSYVIDSSHDVDILEQTAKRGVNIILTSLPDISIFRSYPKLMELTGIRKIEADSYYTNGMTVFEGFLLGGKTTYTELKKSIPYFLLQSGTKTYISASIKHQERKHIKNEELPPVLWRNYYENGFVFSVNYDFFQDHTGLGMLTAMLSETNSYNIYPIVDAQSVICQNFPYLSNENSDRISQQYFYNSKAFCENVLWPDVVSILGATDDKFSGMIAPKLEYSSSAEIDQDVLSFYFKQTERITGELGISGEQMESRSFHKDKIMYDTKKFKQLAPDYTFTVFSPGSMPESAYEGYLKFYSKDSILSNIRTLILPKEYQHSPVLSFYNTKILSMSCISDGFSHTDGEDLYLRSIETALGYSAISLDFSRVLYPSGKSDDWTSLSRDMARYLDTYWKSFRKAFEQVNISQADQKVRKFFALDYHSHRRNNTISLSITNFDEEASFLLDLTDEKIVSVSGGTFIKAEKDKYVIHATKKNVAIEVTEDLSEN
ncbi:MAG: DUF2194 domain-containing protein [Lachnospiraceae bacterium]|nr:DUF2194 domain-containing protein [Lachnospiraceae bacterium]